MITNFFRNKKQTDALKAAGEKFPTLTKTRTTQLKLHNLRIVYRASLTTPFYATITYAERPTKGSDTATEEVELTADTWPELIDKVIKHFGGEDNE